MAPQKKIQRKPAIIVTRSDHDRLLRLAEAHAQRDPEVAGELLSELDRARIVKDGKISANVVCMGSTLRFASEIGEDRTVTLVFPGDADIAAGKISILTPIGTALIGLSVGQSIDWAARDGRVRRLTVDMVVPPAAGALAQSVEQRSAP